MCHKVSLLFLVFLSFSSFIANNWSRSFIVSEIFERNFTGSLENTGL